MNKLMSYHRKTPYLEVSCEVNFIFYMIKFSKDV